MLSVNMSIFWVVFNILLLFILLRIFLFKPLQKLATKRSELIQGQIDQATQMNQDAAALKEQYENSLKNAKDQSAQIVSDAKDRAQMQYDQIVNKANEDAERIVQQANQTAEADRAQMMRSTQAELADLALTAASKILESTVDDDANKKLLDDFLTGEEADKQ